MDICLACRQGFPEECENVNSQGGRNCLQVHSKEQEKQETQSRIQDGQVLSIEKQGQGRPRKPNDQIQDVRSTGRKRANVDYPRDPEGDCEWKGSVNCGGGRHPIPGCNEGKQDTNHHGPDKDKLLNHKQGICKDPDCPLPIDAPNNVHSICFPCHNLWHARNDKDYDPSIPHQPILLVSLKEQVQIMIKHRPEILKELLTV